MEANMRFTLGAEGPVETGPDAGAVGLSGAGGAIIGFVVTWRAYHLAGRLTAFRGRVRLA